MLVTIPRVSRRNFSMVVPTPWGRSLIVGWELCLRFAHESTSRRASALPHAVPIRIVDLAVRGCDSDYASDVPSHSTESYPNLPA